MEEQRTQEFIEGKKYACERIIDFLIAHEETINKVSAAPFIFALINEINKIKAEHQIMKTGFEGYDQWKTASPDDDIPDSIEMAEKWLKMADDPEYRKLYGREFSPREIGLLTTIEGLLQILKDEGLA